PGPDPGRRARRGAGPCHQPRCDCTLEARAMSQPVIDADGHVTESTEQVAKYLADPYRRRPLGFPFYPSDGWDRRLLGTLGDLGGDAAAWLRALDKGGIETTILYPTLGLFMSFIKDREWAVALC